MLARGLYRYDARFRRARVWSNRELKEIAPYFTGDIINVSGWADEDKTGGTYRRYFVNARSYSISNKEGGAQQGKNLRLEDSIVIDLEYPLPGKYAGAYDCVFTHTVLEHVFNFFPAVENICKMSRDTIICVVPFVQMIHKSPDYLDYWRFTPYALERLFNQHGFSMVYASGGPDFDSTSLLYVWVVSRNPEKWANVFGSPPEINELPSGERIYKTWNEKARALLRLLLALIHR